MKKHLLSLCFLFTASLVVGCAENPDPTLCGNGIIDTGEDCDGNMFGANVRVCPEGTTGDPSLIKCTAACKVDTSNACSTVVCTTGEEKCENNVTLMCQNNAWTNTGISCNEQQVNTPKEGDLKCLENALMIYTGGTWTIKQDCKPDNKTCHPAKGCVGEEQPEDNCENDQKRCESGKYQICKDKKWSDSEDCSAQGKVCKETEGCVKENNTNVCNDGEKTCSGMSYVECKNGQWSVIEACSESDKTCVADKGCVLPTTIECQNDAKSCDNQKYRVCVNNKWTVAEDCSASSKTCTIANGCVASSVADCQAGQAKCANNVYMTCVNGKWNELDCTAINGTCSESAKDCLTIEKECTDNTYECNGKTLKSCVDGKWNTKTCAANETCNANLGKCLKESVCDDNEIRCQNNKFGLCVDGEWMEDDCGSKTCSTEGKGCVDNNTSCANDAMKCNNGSFYLCIEGTWVEEKCEPYGKDCSVEGGGCVQKAAICADNAMRCQNNTLGICIEGLAWLDDAPCAADEICSISAGGCIKGDAQCANENEFRCKDNKLEMCIAGVWVEDKDCNNEYDGLNQKICNKETQACVSSICGNGSIETGEACDGNNIGTKTCSDYNKYIAWDNSGKPGCSECQLTKGTCKEKETVTLKTWKFESSSSIHADGISLNGGFKYNDYVKSSSSWSLGYWGNDKSPNFDKYIQFTVGDISQYSKVWVSFDYEKNSQGPTKVVVGFYDNGSLKGQSTVLVPKTKMQNSGDLSADKALSSKNFAFRIVGYDSPAATTGTLHIANVTVKAQ